jgi:hypothetical protein
VLHGKRPSGPEWLHEVTFDGWRAPSDLDTPVNMVGALLKCCLSQFWKMIVAKPRHVIALKFFDICC